MKRVVIVLSLVILIGAIYVFISKTYYPALPIEDLSAKETIQKLENSDENLVEIATDEGSTWYITRSLNEGVQTADENVEQMLALSGWKFTEKLGAGLFFEKDDKKLMVTTQMWTKKYVLVQVRDEFRE